VLNSLDNLCVILWTIDLFCWNFQNILLKLHGMKGGLEFTSKASALYDDDGLYDARLQALKHAL
jgi:hypothetical protein